MPADAASYDDASNNRALISGKSALIFNPPSAVQIYNRGIMPAMVAKLQSGQSIKDVIGWAQEELEGFVR
jgi:hypothetical protein